MISLQNRTVLITGGATGIGLAFAKALVERDNQVIICGRNAVKLGAATAIVPGLIAYTCDITESGSRTRLLKQLEFNHPKLDVLFNNAGVQVPRDFLGGTELNGIEDEVAVNLTAPIQMIGALLPLLLKQEKALIANVTSGLAFAPLARIPVYCATKAAMHSFSMTLRSQLSSTNVSVIEVAPPMVETELRNKNIEREPGKPPMLTAEEFVIQAIQQIKEGKPEVLVGMAAGLRAQGEGLFAKMNRSSTNTIDPVA